MQSLISAVAALAAARQLDQVIRTVRLSARALTHADGVTFVLCEGTDCCYADEKNTAPTWKGERFPVDTCIFGRAMLTRHTAALAVRTSAEPGARAVH